MKNKYKIEKLPKKTKTKKNHFEISVIHQLLVYTPYSSRPVYAPDLDIKEIGA